MLKNWLKIAFINYRKNWLSTLINILGLSVGLCVFLLIFIHWQDEKSYEQWIPDKENIYFIENGNAAFGIMSSSSYPEIFVSKEKFSEIEDATVYNDWGKEKLSVGSNSAYVSGSATIDSFFSFFPFEKVAGNLQNALSDNGKIVISDKTARLLFGDDYLNAVGKSVKSDSKVKEYVVTAIYKLPETNTVFKPDFMYRNPYMEESKDKWTNFNYKGFFRLKPGTDIKALENKLSKQMQQQDEIISKKWGYTLDKKNPATVYLTPISKMKLDAKSEGINKGDKKSIMILLGLSVLILALSGINLINLKTAQASQRAKEVGVRKVVGSSKSALILQFLLETFMICLAAYVVAFAMVELLLPSYNKFLSKDIKLIDPNLFVYTGLLLIVFSLISGLIPALYLSNFKPINTLKGNFARSKNGIWLRNGILTLQLVISSFFIICSLIIHTQVSYMMNKDLGFKGDQTIQINFKKTNWENDFNVNKYRRLKNEVARIPGVTDITGSVNSIGTGSANMSIVKLASDTTKTIQTMLGGIDENFLKFYKVKFLSGRDLDWKKASDTISGAVVNETFAGKLGYNPKTALGKDFFTGWDGKKKYKILGVVKDINYAGVEQAVMPIVYFNYDRNWIKNNLQNLQIKISKDDINGTLERIKEFWITKAEPGYPYDFEFVDKQFAKTYEKFQKQQTLFTTLNIVVLLIALLGLFALSSLLIEQKLKDVAIKKTLGADEKTLIWDLTKRFLLICATAVFISIPFGYYAMNEWLKDFAYRIDMPVWPYVLSLILLLILTFVVVSFKAYRATKINLVKYLKYE
ncbi:MULTISPECIES: ABC transporter permease [Chryseobacterium]|uniref:ABC transport system permease protein n=1 Tax=Chryseobacterium camelliae TaxID=1265445 RepID=A0ABU0TE35_9FLAO|nr:MULTISPECIES: ABC transporter permease [Chryseobacterium]MDT3406867.1 putative ABC transport system permease protein [Pseudacidovorax intermedius]MDQ1095337.1 putative ABC transport system permease protein [Chryseobacterium camelliae]MDQ1099276.1 putative ABC transport system permease protein [Chryseobacterium sp. SORGH_AS_1048]MDR6086625.1 putative ABC transport system permease protein [Chryseobacterium sp. SORGH_AS_0909]MDR6130996.1 putative ABC transport system permease protein [Chryseob